MEDDYFGEFLTSDESQQKPAAVITDDKNLVVSKVTAF